MHKSAKFLLTLYVFVFLCNMMYKYAVCVKYERIDRTTKQLNI